MTMVKTKVAASTSKKAARQKRKQKSTSSSGAAAAPKRALSAFMYFSNQHRKQVMDENPGVKFGEVGKILGKMWREASEEDKREALELAAADKARYEKEKTGVARKPKRGLTPFMIFSQKYREQVKQENPDAKFGEIGKLLGEMWRQTSEEDKQPFVDQAAIDKVRYDEEMTTFQEHESAETERTEAVHQESSSEHSEASEESDDEMNE